MLRRRPPPELGALLLVHRPLNPFIAWAFLAAISCPFAILAALGPPGPLVGLFILLGFALPFTFGFAEWILLQHRIHEHGIVFCSIPGLRTYIVPFHTVRPDGLDVQPRQRKPRGEFRVAERQQRECPLVASSVHLTGLAPELARELAKGRLQWADAGTGGNPAGVGISGAARSVVRWRASFRNAAHHRDVLGGAIRSSQQTHPYSR